MGPSPHPTLTEDEYLAWDLSHEGKHEFDGVAELERIEAALDR